MSKAMTIVMWRKYWLFWYIMILVLSMTIQLYWWLAIDDIIPEMMVLFIDDGQYWYLVVKKAKPDSNAMRKIQWNCLKVWWREWWLNVKGGSNCWHYCSEGAMILILVTFWWSLPVLFQLVRCWVVHSERYSNCSGSYYYYYCSHYYYVLLLLFRVLRLWLTGGGIRCWLWWYLSALCWKVLMW